MDRREFLKMQAGELFDKLDTEQQNNIIIQLTSMHGLRKILSREAEREAERRFQSMKK